MFISFIMFFFFLYSHSNMHEYLKIMFLGTKLVFFFPLKNKAEYRITYFHINVHKNFKNSSNSKFTFVSFIILSDDIIHIMYLKYLYTILNMQINTRKLFTLYS